MRYFLNEDLRKRDVTQAEAVAKITLKTVCKSKGFDCIETSAHQVFAYGSNGALGLINKTKVELTESLLDAVLNPNACAVYCFETGKISGTATFENAYKDAAYNAERSAIKKSCDYMRAAKANKAHDGTVPEWNGKHYCYIKDLTVPFLQSMYNTMKRAGYSNWNDFIDSDKRGASLRDKATQEMFKAVMAATK